MTLREKLLLTVQTFQEGSPLSLASVSTVAVGGGHRLQSIADGGDLTTRTFEAAMQWLSDHWPEGVDWPDGVERPAPQREAAE